MGRVMPTNKDYSPVFLSRDDDAEYSASASLFERRATTMPNTLRVPCSLSARAQAAMVDPDEATSSMIQKYFPAIFVVSNVSCFV